LRAAENRGWRLLSTITGFRRPTMKTETSLEPGGNGQLAAAAAASRSSVSREFHNVLADIEDLIKATTSLTGDELSRARAKLNARVAVAKQSLDEMGGAMALQARQAATVTNDYVHAEPWKAIGVGAAVGFLLGIVLARRA